MLRLTHIAVAFLAVALTGSVARADVPVDFSGGSGTFLTLTFSQSISYTATSATNQPLFLFQGAGNVINPTFPPTSGTATFSINGGSPNAITTIASGILAGDVSPNDVYFYRNVFTPILPGDIITLSTGTVSTTTLNGPAAPASGNYTTFLVNAATAQTMSGNGTVPEPASLSVLALAGVGLLRRRRN